MQKNYKISVIIPVYNSEKYIGRCLRSLKRQSLNKKNYEIIIINDCSKDNSMNEIKKYLDGNIKVIHNKMETLLGRHGAYLDRLYYCPHHTDSGFEGEIETLKFDCDCRKPKIGLFLKAKKDLNIVLEKSWVIGDSIRDILAAQNAGIPVILLEDGYTEKNTTEIYHNHLVKDFVGIEKIILKYL